MPGEPYKISGKEGKTMKEYEKPQMEVIELSGTDIITTSCTPTDGVPWWGGEGG